MSTDANVDGGVAAMGRKFVRSVAPDWLTASLRSYFMTQRAKRLQDSAAHISTVDEAVAVAFAYGYFYPNQIRSEVTALLHVLERARPKRVMEIGSQGGGNLFLMSKFSAPNAQILSVDLNFSPDQMASYPSLASSSQRLSCFKGDSSSPEMLARVKSWLGDDRLDFLFIDGDHTLPGVTADYRAFAPLVAPGGLIAFHDIVPDFTTRFGKKTSAHAGDVPIFWNELKAKLPESQEFIDHPDQDGAGIGLTTWSGQFV